ncbi:hypothetical protein RhiJN_05776 [Ceratobasidium sp. AG-Ba]|nr:hypothetical protein RhiJN_05776 [Ceratobasidium sp. AG-Ba]QRW06706.1 hypothetical protein RhiLY_05705 [Ceratobasidium sp. AG-Ba]
MSSPEPARLVLYYPAVSPYEPTENATPLYFDLPSPENGQDVENCQDGFQIVSYDNTLDKHSENAPMNGADTPE